MENSFVSSFGVKENQSVIYGHKTKIDIIEGRKESSPSLVLTNYKTINENTSGIKNILTVFSTIVYGLTKAFTLSFDIFQSVDIQVLEKAYLEAAAQALIELNSTIENSKLRKKGAITNSIELNSSVSISEIRKESLTLLQEITFSQFEIESLRGLFITGDISLDISIDEKSVLNNAISMVIENNLLLGDFTSLEKFSIENGLEVSFLIQILTQLKHSINLLQEVTFPQVFFTEAKKIFALNKIEQNLELALQIRNYYRLADHSLKTLDDMKDTVLEDLFYTTTSWDM